MQINRWSGLAGVFFVVVLSLVLSGCTTTGSKIPKKEAYTIGSRDQLVD